MEVWETVSMLIFTIENITVRTFSNKTQGLFVINTKARFLSEQNTKYFTVQVTLMK